MKNAKKITVKFSKIYIHNYCTALEKKPFLC